MAFSPPGGGVLGSDISIGEIEGATLVLESEGIASNDNDSTIPTSAAVKDFGDASYQPLDAGLTDVSGLAVTDGNFIVGDGANWVAESGATARTSLGLGDAAVKGVTGADANAVTGTAGTNGNLAIWNADGDIVDSSTAESAILTDSDKTGADSGIVSGTAGTNNYTAKWNSDGDLVDGYEVKDEDNMVSDSATALATQQSIKAYVDTEVAGAGGTIYLDHSYYFRDETDSRFNEIAVNGTYTYGLAGCTLDSSATQNGYAKIRAQDTSEDLLFSDTRFGLIGKVSTAPTGSGTVAFVAGKVDMGGTGYTGTNHHYGFTIEYSGGTATLYASSGDGTTQEQTDITSGITVTDANLYYADFDGTTVTFYVNGTQKATHTTNVPSSPGGAGWEVGATNENTADATAFDAAMLILGFKAA